MRELTFFEKIKEVFFGLPLRIKQLFCKHVLFTSFSAEVFTKEKWERCSGNSTCIKCQSDFEIQVPDNEEKIEELMRETYS